MTERKTYQADADQNFTVPVSLSDIVRVDVLDVDLILTTKSGAELVLPKAAFESMKQNAPLIRLEGSEVRADEIFARVGEVRELTTNQIFRSFEKDVKELKETCEPLKDELEHARADLEDQQDLKNKQNDLESKIEDMQAQIEEQQAQIDQQAEALEQAQKTIDETSQLQTEEAMDEINDAEGTIEEKSVSKFTEEMKKVVESTANKNYDYVAPGDFKAPSTPFAGPPGVPAPLSMTPLVTLSMGNIVDNTVVGGTIYGSGGATGSGALDDIGPRDALQFSATTIEGTDGNDTIYAQGPAVGNDDPSVSISNYAKEFSLSVAGYFSSLDDIVLAGIPDYVSVVGATLQADGSWVLPSDTVLTKGIFTFVYDKDAWRADSQDYFDVVITIAGELKNAPFESTDTFRFQFMDVTDISQVTDATLVTWLDSQTKQIYILPTMDQPNIITHGEGNDTIYGGQSHDTITGGDGNNLIIAYEGNNIITEGNGNNTITTLEGNDTIIVGDGSNTIDAGAGDDTITVGAGNNNTITGGSGDDTITVYDVAGVANTINDTDGTNTISVGEGDNTITTGVGDDTITVRSGAGTNTIDAGAGDNTIYLYGTGSNAVTVGDGDNQIYSGLGSNTFTVGTGTNTVNYSLATEALTINMQTGSVTDTATAGVNVNDSFSDIYTVVGSDHGDIIIGNDAGTTIYGGDGVNTITGGSGDDIIYAGDGGDTIDGGGGSDALYGGAGSDTFINPVAGTVYDGTADGTVVTGEYNLIDYSAEVEVLAIDLSGGTGAGGSAQGSTYEDINHVIGGAGNDTLTAGSADTILEGRNGSDRLTGGSGDDILIGGAGTDYLRGGGGDNILQGDEGTNYYYGGIGNDTMYMSSTAENRLYYIESAAGVVVNLDVVEHTFVDSSGATRTIAAQSGASNKSATDQISHAIGDTYSDGVGGDAVFYYIEGSHYNDVIFGNSENTSLQAYYGQGGSDAITGTGNGGIDFFSLSEGGGDRYNGVDGVNDIFYVTANSPMRVYLDGSLDSNGNGKADYIDAGRTLADGYDGFVYGWGGTNYITNIDNILGHTGNDILVGNNNNNIIDGRVGSNTLYGMGGSDTFIITQGSNIVDGGTGTDTIDFWHRGLLDAWSADVSGSVEVFLSNDTALNGHSTSGWLVGTNVHTIYAGANYYSTVTNVENINGSGYVDYLAGDSRANVINGNGGNDWITGNGGADTLNGGDGNDTILVKASAVASVSSVDGGSGTNTLMLTPNADGGTQYTFGAGVIDSSHYVNFDVLDVRDQSNPGSASVNSYQLTVNDIQSLVNDGTASTLTLRLDSGDTFTAVTGAGTGGLNTVLTVDTGTAQTYLYYSDAGTSNLAATLQITYGIV